MTTNTLVAGEHEIWRNSQWRVTNKFLEEVADPELAGPPYWIAIDDLHYPDVLRHVCEKAWVNPAMFVEAYRKAADVAGFVPDEMEIQRVLATAEE
jgi:hypothetical protein